MWSRPVDMPFHLPQRLCCVPQTKPITVMACILSAASSSHQSPICIPLELCLAVYALTPAHSYASIHEVHIDQSLATYLWDKHQLHDDHALGLSSDYDDLFIVRRDSWVWRC
ncbi:hypothetical protein BV22DRAFT_641582 [Leucogyrophana mollusca]|uniref:Uncharacterized protein n=1 Tax=Leucogyrophana mollusca TaxID=85980 RepID=A0ACB8BB78_9AGAM|nr:hypothetical protein BV22DRAFT_641582 [Leucogyrophana mollusca]